MLNSLREEIRPMLKLAIPLILAELSWMSMGIVDTIMVGRLPNSAVALGAVGLGQGLYYAIAIFGSGLLLGLDTIVSQAFGRQDLEDANRSFINSLYLALALTPILMGIVWQWPPLMRRIGIGPNLMAQLEPFLKALNWGTLPLLLYFATRRYLQAVNLVKPVTWAFVTANVVNALGNWIFIYGRLGVPAYGVAGSGWSTCVARAYMVLFLMGALIYHNGRSRLGIWSARKRLELRRIKDLLFLGLPAAGQILCEIGAFAAATALVGKLGAPSLAGHEIALNCASVTFMIPLGISSAAAVRVGQKLGAKDFKAARRAGWTAILLAAAFMSCTALVFFCFSRQLARIFSPDPEVIRRGSVLLLIAAVFQVFDGIQGVTTGVLRGTGDTRTPMVANFVAYWIVGLPLGYWLCFRLGLGAPGIWVGLCTGLILIGSGLLWVWKGQLQKEDPIQIRPNPVI